LSDLHHFWGNDLSVSSSGDIALANHTDSTQQQILRALLTNPALFDRARNPLAAADYTDHPDYGAGLPRRIGETLDVRELRAIVRGAVIAFPGVARTPSPAIVITPFENGATIDITYVDVITGETETLSFDLNR
jgi:hypothetical protein